MRHTRTTPLRKLIVLLSVVLAVLCIFAAVSSGLLSFPPEEGTAEYTLWRYAKEHGYSLRDYPDSLIHLLKILRTPRI